MRVFAWVKMEDGTYFRKKKEYLKVTSVVEESEDRFVDGATIGVGTRIECVGGTNIGLKGRVVKVTAFFYRFEVEGLSKLKMVKKNNAKAIVDWEKPIEGIMQVPDAKKRKSENDLVNLVLE